MQMWRLGLAWHETDTKWRWVFEWCGDLVKFDLATLKSDVDCIWGEYWLKAAVACIWGQCGLYGVDLLDVELKDECGM